MSELKYYKLASVPFHDAPVYGIKATTTNNEDLANFEVVGRVLRTDEGGEERIATGFVKWDGCMELHLGRQYYCGFAEDFEHRMNLLEAVISRFAEENVENWEGDESDVVIEEVSLEDLKKNGL